MMKKILAMGLLIAMTTMLFAACGSKESAPETTPDTSKDTEVTESKDEATEETTEEATDEAKYADGYYFAKEGAFSENSGWKYYVILEVKDGLFTDINWNAVHIGGGIDKYALSESGGYPMVEKGNAIDEWYVQADRMMAHFMETQDPTDVNFTDEDGHTDSVTGVTIKVSAMYTLIEEALAAGPQEMGPYADGTYHAEEPEFSEKSGWKSTVDIAVVFGNIEAVNWSGIHKDGGEDKKTASVNGNYPMVANGGAQSEWYEQAALAEAHLIAAQDPTAIEYADDNYHTDAITGVSIGVSPLFKLAEEALSTAK